MMMTNSVPSMALRSLDSILCARRKFSSVSVSLDCWKRMMRSRSSTRASMINPMSKKATFFSDMKASKPSNGAWPEPCMMIEPSFLRSWWKAPRKTRASRPTFA